SRVARYDGVAWSAMHTGMSENVHLLFVRSNGELIDGGDFLVTGVGSAQRRVNRPEELPGGDLLVGGVFTMVGTQQLNNIARWDGVSWSGFGGGTNGAVYSVDVLPNGDVLAGGGFLTAGGAPARRVARWNGSVWAPLGTGMDGLLHVSLLRALPNGDVIAGGFFSAAGGVAVNC